MMDTREPGEYEAFVIKNRRAYLPRFERFDALGGNFTPTWHWSAFFFAPLWLFYRKLYLWGAAALAVSMFGATAAFVHVACGLCGYFLYYRRTRSVILSLRQANPGQDIRGRAMDLGGVHGWFTVLALALLCLILIGLACGAFFGFKYFGNRTSWV